MKLQRNSYALIFDTEIWICLRSIACKAGDGGKETEKKPQIHRKHVDKWIFNKISKTNQKIVIKECPGLPRNNFSPLLTPIPKPFTSAKREMRDVTEKKGTQHPTNGLTDQTLLNWRQWTKSILFKAPAPSGTEIRRRIFGVDRQPDDSESQ